MHRIARRGRILLGTLLPVSLGLFPTSVAAKPDVAREGLQIEGLIGGSNCLPGRAACRSDNPRLSGVTRGAIGGGAAVGWRAWPFLFVGVMYRGGMFRPDYELVDGRRYGSGVQHSAFVVARASIPIWRFDLGLSVAPGYSHQTFRYEGGARDYTQGFALAVGPVVDIFVARHLFVGFEADFIFNAHRRVCEVRSGSTACTTSRDRYPTPVHQAIYGLHVGFTAG